MDQHGRYCIFRMHTVLCLINRLTKKNILKTCIAISSCLGKCLLAYYNKYLIIELLFRLGRSTVNRVFVNTIFVNMENHLGDICNVFCQLLKSF